MSGFVRKVQRNKLKSEMKKNGMKRTMPLSKYRFKTEEEIREEQAARITEQMIKTAKEAEDNNASNE
jgi:hypothetical protein